MRWHPLFVEVFGNGARAHTRSALPDDGHLAPDFVAQALPANRQQLLTVRRFRDAPLAQPLIPRWFLAHRDVEFSYDLVRNLGYKIPASIPELNEKMQELHKSGRHPVIRDYRVLEMYAEVIQAKKKVSERRGNWAQPFATDADGQIFVVSQFLRYSRAIQDVEKGPLSALRQMTKKSGGKK